jgi:hypothetical protein
MGAMVGAADGALDGAVVAPPPPLHAVNTMAAAAVRRMDRDRMRGLLEWWRLGFRVVAARRAAWRSTGIRDSHPSG